MSGVRGLVRDWLPPVLLGVYRRMRGESIAFRGNYPDWQAAQADSRGYADAVIVERVSQALLQVRAGAGAFERDGVVLPRQEYDFPLLAALLHVAATRGRLHVADFGGSLGSTYFQHRELLRGIPDLRWDVVEQAHFVERGRAEFADAVLGFQFSLQDCLAAGQPNVVLLSSVLPYMPKPYELIAQVRASGAEFVLLNRTPALPGDSADLLAVQHVALAEYQTSYPAWLLGQARLFAAFAPEYRLVLEFESDEQWQVGAQRANAVGGLLQRVGA
jgi:putative methyltransferase (TIGR04325 family)